MNREPREEKKKLEWESVITIKKGDSEVVVQRAATPRGMLYSVSVGRSRDGRTTRYLRPADLRGAAEALREAELWIDADRDEQRRERDKNGRRR